MFHIRNFTKRSLSQSSGAGSPNQSKMTTVVEELVFFDFKVSELSELPELSCNYLTRSFSHQKEIETNHFICGANVKPHPDKVDKGGEDAYYVAESIMAVADGVGGWADVGVDPSDYSRILCKNLGEYMTEDPEHYIQDPKTLIKDTASKTRVEGSSTLCVVTLDQNQPLLRASYVGDAGYTILRKIKGQLTVVHCSTEQLKSFNYPYQLGTRSDSADIAIEETYDMEHNDIIVVGSDGLFDNMDPEQICTCIRPFTENESGDLVDNELIAEIIAETAHSLSLDRAYNSPFAQKAAKCSYTYTGGKSDDITVVVGQAKIKKSGVIDMD